MNQTKIEWVKNPDGTQGYTWNPITGCLNGCPYCYARKLANGRLRSRYLANRNISPEHSTSGTYNKAMTYGNPFYPRFWEDRLKQLYKLAPSHTIERFKPNNQYMFIRDFTYDLPPLERVVCKVGDIVTFTGHSVGCANFYLKRNDSFKHIVMLGKEAFTHLADLESKTFGKGIFVCDMSDLFGIGIPEEWTNTILNAIKACPQHRFYLLTKQPQNLIKFSPFPDNCWVGVTATNRVMYLKATGAEGLDGIEAKVKYISFEPLLEAIHPSEYRLKGIDWVIIGAQTKPYKPPEISWVEEIVRACDKAGVKVFLKNNLEPLLHGKDPFIGAIDIYTDDKTYELKLRQEMPQEK